MTTRLLRRLWHYQRSDAGFMMPTALFIALIATTASVLVVGTVLVSMRFSQRGAERAQDYAAAEAGIDAAIAAMEQGKTFQMPCKLTQPNTTNQSYQVYVQYFDAAGAALNSAYNRSTSFSTAVNCLTSSAEPRSALITSLGQTAKTGMAGVQGEKTMQSMVNLAPLDPWVVAFPEVLQAGSNVSVQNNWTLTGAGGDLLVNGNFTCGSTMTVQGNLYVSGTINITGNCDVGRDMWAGGNITIAAGGGASVTGSVMTPGTLSISSGTLPVGGTVFAASVSGSYTSSGGLVTGVITTGPDVVAFPTAVYNSADWTGWNIVRPLSTAFPCTRTGNSITAPVSGTTNTLYLVTNPAGITGGCTTVNLQSAATVTMKADITIYAPSFTSQSNWTFVSDNANTPRKLRIIVPSSSSSTCPVAGAGNITFGGQFNVQPPVKAFIYTQGQVNTSGQLNMTGQLYSCSTNFGQNMTVNFAEVGIPTGAAGSGSATGGQTTYQVNVVYKRDM